MDAFTVTLFLFTAVGVMILLFFRHSSPAVSPVPRSGGRLTATNDGPVLLAPCLLRSCAVGDPDGTIIWSSQIPALRFVCEHEPQGALCADLKHIYLELARRYPEIYEGHKYHDWGQLLVDLDLFRVEAKRVHITPAGRALLDMVVAATQRQTRETLRSN